MGQFRSTAGARTSNPAGHQTVRQNQVSGAHKKKYTDYRHILSEIYKFTKFFWARYAMVRRFLRKQTNLMSIQ
jgi:hypothetical protein